MRSFVRFLGAFSGLRLDWGKFTAKREAVLRAAELRLALGVEGFDALTEIVGLPQPAVTMAFQLDRCLQIGVFGGVEQRLRRALRQRRGRA
jgi:hypothetical protein